MLGSVAKPSFGRLRLNDKMYNNDGHNHKMLLCCGSATLMLSALKNVDFFQPSKISGTHFKMQRIYPAILYN